MLWAIILLAALVLGLVARVFIDNTQKDGLPPNAPYKVPFLGNIISFASPLEFLSSNKQKYGNVFRSKILGRWMTFIVHPEHHHVFYRSSNEVFSPREVYEVMTPIFGRNCVYDAPYPRMREQLNFAAQELNINNFVQYVPVIAECTREFLKKNWGASGKANLLDTFSTLIVMTASKCLLGPEVSEMLPPERFGALLSQLEDGINPLGVFYPWLPSPGARSRDRARVEMADILKTVIRKRGEMDAKGDDTDRGKSDMVNALRLAHYRDGSKVPEDEQIGVLIGAMFAGQHTSLITATWTTLFLAYDKEAREKFLDERKQLDGEYGTELTYDHVNKAEYAEACVKESLRLHPPLIMLMRAVKQSTKVGNYTVPAGDIIVNSPLMAMRSDDIYANPEKWDPSRFLAPRKEHEKMEYSFVGFGAGAHRCLGEKFGLMQTKTIVETMFELYDISLENGKLPGPNYHSMVVGPIKEGCNVKYSKRA